MSPVTTNSHHCHQRMADFYRNVMSVLDAAGTPYLVGGSYAAEVYTGIPPHTKDLDVFIRRSDLEQVMGAAAAAGLRSELAFPHWLAKIHSGDGDFVDLIFSSGNGICVVDDEWFAHARQAEVMGHSVAVCPVEEIIWSKAFIMERERFDGADVAHLIRACSGFLDWTRLNKRFGPHWRVLMIHLLLFGFVYPHLREEIPEWLMRDLASRWDQEQRDRAPTSSVCYGTLLSRQQYLCDIQKDGLVDARLAPSGTMTPSQIAIWTDAIARDGH